MTTTKGVAKVADDLSVAEAVEIVCDIAERSGEVAWLAGKWAASDRAFEAVEIIRGVTTWLSEAEAIE